MIGIWNSDEEDEEEKKTKLTVRIDYSLRNNNSNNKNTFKHSVHDFHWSSTEHYWIYFNYTSTGICA